ncbi:HdeA family protein [Sulfitobacter sp. S223]|uniref:HdeA family protein n=1 Tax=Sulfitobacter sp. S223 TaxID=2867023 RepID=UPI0021A55048|nr:HdeA family protein [Sulfitobacter sp. S223]UWR26632.1 HdeA family protein [Sulfitobacter sp. S223]
MTRFLKTTAIAALAMSTAMPAFAAAHLDVNSMTCAQYNELSAEDKNKVAVMAVAEISGATGETIEENDGVATATAPLEGEAAAESETGSSTTVADNNGEETATSTVPAGDDMTEFAENVELLNLTCERNIDAMVTEAAAGMEGTR